MKRADSPYTCPDILYLFEDSFFWESHVPKFGPGLECAPLDTYRHLLPCIVNSALWKLPQAD